MTDFLILAGLLVAVVAAIWVAANRKKTDTTDGVDGGGRDFNNDNVKPK